MTVQLRVVGDRLVRMLAFLQPLPWAWVLFVPDAYSQLLVVAAEPIELRPLGMALVALADCYAKIRLMPNNHNV